MRRFSLALLLFLGACSVEGTRQLGDTCITSRECAAGLLCEFNAVGNSQCVRGAVFDAAAVDVVRPVDNAPADNAPADNAPADNAPADTGVEVVTDVAVEAASPDVAVDVPARDVVMDAGPDVTDVGADVTDAADARPDVLDVADDDRPDAAPDGG